MPASSPSLLIPPATDLTPELVEKEALLEEEDFEIDPEVDPLSDLKPQSLAEWEITVKHIVPREPLAEDPKQLTDFCLV